MVEKTQLLVDLRSTNRRRSFRSCLSRNGGFAFGARCNVFRVFRFVRSRHLPISRFRYVRISPARHKRIVTETAGFIDRSFLHGMCPRSYPAPIDVFQHKVEDDRTFRAPFWYSLDKYVRHTCPSHGQLADAVSNLSFKYDWTDATFGPKTATDFSMSSTEHPKRPTQ